VIARILPAAVIAVEARSDPLDLVLFAEEQAALGQAVEKRRREFTTARDCARRALGQLGFPQLPIPSGTHGEPRWPVGVVGSITHCHGYRACAVARTSELLAVGIDAEPNEPLPAGVLATIARGEELPRLDELARVAPEVHWDRLLFSAKEAVYKAWFPLTGISLDFEDATLVFDARTRGFSARLLASAPSSVDVRVRKLSRLSGRWLVRDGLILTAIALSLSEIRNK